MDSGQSRPFNGFTLAQLKARVDNIYLASEPECANDVAKLRAAMIAEIARREAVAAGDTSLMTQSERFTAMNKKIEQNRKDAACVASQIAERGFKGRYDGRKP